MLDGQVTSCGEVTANATSVVAAWSQGLAIS